MDLELSESLLEETAREFYDNNQKGHALLSEPYQSTEQRGQHWTGKVPTCLDGFTEVTSEAIEALEEFFPGEGAFLLREGLCLSHSSEKCDAEKEMPVLESRLCGNCEESEPTLVCIDCQNSNADLDVLFCEKCYLIHTSTKLFKFHSSEPYDPPEAPPHPIVGVMASLLSDVEKMIEQEISFQFRLAELKKLLRQLSYVSFVPVRAFLSSPPCAAFRVGVDSITMVSDSFLQSLRDIKCETWRGKLKMKHHSNVDELLAFSTSIETVIFTAIEKHILSFEAYVHPIVFFGPLYKDLSENIRSCPEFGSYMQLGDGEKGQCLLSLLSRPLPVVPSYIAACKKMYEKANKLSTLVNVEYLEVLQYTVDLAKRVYFKMVNVLLFIYNEAKEAQEKINLQELYDSFIKGQSSFDISGLVGIGRRILYKGVLKRHLKSGQRGKNGLCTVHAMSDILLCSSNCFVPIQPEPKRPLKKSVSFENGILKSSADESSLEVSLSSHDPGPAEYDSVPGALHLDLCIPLCKRSGTVCLPLPSYVSGAESCWFVVISPQKHVFLCAESTGEREHWVTIICDILSANMADNDVFRLKNQRSLVNTLLGEINAIRSTPSARKAPRSEDLDFQAMLSLQPNWWALFDVLEGIMESQSPGGEPSSKNKIDSPVGHLRQVIELHAQEFKEMLLSMCSSPSSRDDVSAALSTGPGTEHLVAVDWFFQKSEAEAEADTPRRWGRVCPSRPSILLVFVTSNVLLAMRVIPQGDDSCQQYSLDYGFHIELRNMVCSHYVWGESNSAKNMNLQSSAILLKDISITAKFKSLLGQSDVSERVVFAPTIPSKSKWLKFLNCCIEMSRVPDAVSTCNERVKILRDNISKFNKLSNKKGTFGIWKPV